MTSLQIAHGPRQAEELLLDRLREQAEAARRDPKLLRDPVLVVVPSRELRDHLALRAAEAGVTVGVEILSLHALALRLHRDAGSQPETRSAWVEVLARREAEREPQLRELLADLQDGMGLAASSIRDLLSARVREGDHPVVRAARCTAEAMQAAEVSRPGDWQERAAALVPELLRARAVLIHGFADATGQALALLRALVEQGAEVILDLPPDPALPQRPDRGARIAQHFAQRVQGEIAPVGQLPQLPAPRLAQFHAAGPQDELREVAQRVRKLLKQGVAAHRIGIVVRQLEPYALALRQTFTEFGLPWRAGFAPAAWFPEHRRMQAALQLLRQGGECSIDRWLDAHTEHAGGEAGLRGRDLADLRLMFRTLGLSRVHQAARFPAAQALGERTRFPLPVRLGLREGSAPSTEEGSPSTADSQELLPYEKSEQAVRRSIERGTFLGAFAAAVQAVRTLQDWPKEASVEEHARRTRQFLTTHLGWPRPQRESSTPWADLLRKIAELGEMSCTRGEFLLVLEREARHYAVEALAGESGVAVMDVNQARACTFEHLFLIGLNRGVFPRVAQADPILDDTARTQLRAQGLVDLHGSERTADEESYLFAQLCAAADQVTLSWQRADEEGRELPPSPFVQRLWLAENSGLVEGEGVAIPRLREQLWSERFGVRNLRESLAYAGLRGDATAWRSLLPAALLESRARLEPLDPETDFEDAAHQEWTRARLDAISAFEAWSPQQEAWTAWSGMLGQSLASAEPVAVTRLERFAACGWQAFLSHHLRLAPTPDPMLTLPDLTPALIGSAAHAALELLFLPPEGARLPHRVKAPSASEVEQAVSRAALQVALQEEVRASGLVEALARRATPFVERALALEFADRDVIHVQSCESQHQVSVSLGKDGARTLAFTADRVDDDDGAAILTDYKTSLPFARQATLQRRDAALARFAAQGTRLQAAAYAASADGAVGRYLFLREKSGLPDAACIAEVDASHPASDAFAHSAALLLRAREQGIAFARMEHPADQPTPACNYCEFAEACLRRDSGARRRLVQSLRESRDLLIHELWSLPTAEVEA